MLPNLEAYICFHPLKTSMHCHISLQFPLYNLYKWKLNHSQIIWDKKEGVTGNILMNTLETENNYLKDPPYLPTTPKAQIPPPPKKKHEIAISKMVCRVIFKLHYVIIQF